MRILPLKYRLILGAILTMAVAVPADAAMNGQWINPSGSVVVTTGACGDALCGWVSWASDKAQADARQSGTQKLLGTQLLRAYRQTKPRIWAGQVYVPDMGKTYISTIEILDVDRLKISGCVLGGWICKKQIWRRV